MKVDILQTDIDRIFVKVERILFFNKKDNFQ